MKLLVYFVFLPWVYASRQSMSRDGIVPDSVLLMVDTYWVRHGFSCANALNLQKQDASLPAMARVQGMKFIAYSDPPLTDCAINRAKLIGPNLEAEIRKLHPAWGNRKLLVFSSMMLRSLETALYNFPDSTIYPIPHIAEKGLSLDNQPSPADVQLQQLTRFPSNATTVSHISKYHLSNLSRDKKSDYTAFLSEFPVILIELLKEVDFDIDSPIPIVVVSHSHFMRDYLGCSKKSSEPILPFNNQAWLQRYILDTDKLTLLGTGCNPEPFDAKLYGHASEILCPEMVERCEWKPDALLQKYDGRCSAATVRDCSAFEEVTSSQEESLSDDEESSTDE